MRRPFLFFTYLLITWGVYRHFTHFSEPIDEFIFKPILWLLPIFIIVRYIEKRKIQSLGIARKKDSLESFVYGYLFAAFVFSEYIATVYLKFHTISFNPDHLNIFQIATFFFTSLATGITEELVFRGYIMTRLKESWGNKFFANIVSSVLFSLIHLPAIFFIQQPTPSTFLSIIVFDLTLGIVNGYAFYKTESLTAPIISHAAWNFLAVLVK